MFPYLQKEVILVGHSLGGMFLAKYLAENDFPKKILQLHLVAPPHNQTEDVNSFLLPPSLANLQRQSANNYLYFSRDDEIVPFSELAEYRKQLPSAQVFEFGDRGHFRQEHFPELIKNMKGVK
jgi:predicted alpha/beta hydrolase family esterase